MSQPLTKPVLLIVDDEVEILKVLQKSLEDDYDVLTASRAKAGLELLDERVSVVISDQRMPEMTGSEFLRHVRERRPEVVRIIMSGYSDMTALINSVNYGEIFRYLNKPWDLNELLNTIELAVKRYDENRRQIELASENQRLAAENLRLTEDLREKTTEINRLRGK
ncbi:MAG TPA: response regulator [bacterium]|nr:response regulator [bacterium]HNF85571.1 response regulator [bacterium]HNH34227.1 response regulator [bacterium]